MPVSAPETVSLPFADRSAAGRLLGARLLRMSADPGSGLSLARAVVLALPRGGVPAGREVSMALGVPLDVLVTRKIGYPPQPELGVGAVAEGGQPVFDDEILARLGLTEQFGVIASFDDCGAKKPDPASYLLACRQLGVAPERALAVEDSRHGMMAAKAAGLSCVVVPNVMTAHMDFTGADLVLGSLEEAGPLEVIERLGGSPARSELQRH